ncbi:MAG: sigma 54-interacting transcriptional regulator [Calditrichaeota bacterium]|nr:sigma 54-interacting transcriptional regulator [Calditrichota bacterium]
MPDTKLFPEQILNSLGEGIFTVDKNFRINFFNHAAEEITGLRKEECLGRFCKQVFESSLCVDNCPIARVLETGEHIVGVNANIKHCKGFRIPIRINGAVIRDPQSGEPSGGVISFWDLSDIFGKSFDHKHTFHGIVGKSKGMRRIYQLIEEIADSDVSVLIQGESGTGKEMIANAIQATSERRHKPFVKVNCSVFPPQLLASELFGHVRGAFTGAVKNRIGRFEMAHQGTLFLDEVGEMPPQMQLQLLRVLQEGTFERVGESVTRKVDVRIIAASNIDLEAAIAAGKFRQDLYYRLNVLPVELPPLRERAEDIALLADFFRRKFSQPGTRQVDSISAEVLDLLLAYHWPGNVRELENAIESAVARCSGPQIRREMLPPRLRQPRNGSLPVPPTNGALETALPGEAQQILTLLKQYHWNRSRVARELGIGRTTLWRKMKMLGVEGE